MSRKRRKVSKKKLKKFFVSIIILMLILVIDYFYPDFICNLFKENLIQKEVSYNISDIPEYTDSPYVVINDNIPDFDEKDYVSKGFEQYSKLDILGRCGVAYANVCMETMPPEGDERGDISSVKPTGWKQKKYSGEYLYNRCHLIGYQLSDEDANELNLITGTRYFNVEGMLPFENKVAEYLKQNKDNHVLYRITPIYEGTNLLASGVQMEAYSIEDSGKGVCFNVYIYNVEPGIKIDYATGNSSKEQ